MSKYGSSYNGNDFLEWWKTHYGTDYDGSGNIVKRGSMTDQDIAIGQELLGVYNRKNHIQETYDKNYGTISGYYDDTLNLLEQNYGKAQDALDKSKRQSQQSASIVYDKLKKYLPTQIKAQGLGGLGVSESSMLQAYNNYNSDMGAIEGDYQDRTANLLQNYTQTRSETENAKTGELSELEQAYSTDMFNADKDASGNFLVDNVNEKFRTEQKGEFDSNYLLASSALASSGVTTVEEANAFVEQYRGKVSDDQLLALFKEGEGVARNNQGKNFETTYTAAMDNIGALHYTSQDEMDAYINENYRGKVTESQLNNLFSRGKTIVSNNVKDENDRIAKEDDETKNGQYSTEANNIEVMYQSMIGDDGKISQADYDKLASYVTEKGTPLGDKYLALLNSQLNGYAGTIRSKSSQDALDKQTAMATPTVNSQITIDGNLNTANDDHGDSFKISYNGTSYKVEKGYDASDDTNRKLMDAYTASTGSAPAKGAVMIYGGRIYMYLENNDANQDRWCVVQQRKNTYASHFANLCKELGLTVYSRDYKD